MWQQTKEPVPNIPEVMFNFITLLSSLIKDPKQLDGMVKAARDITEANKMTAEQSKALRDAQDTIAAAAPVTASLEKLRGELTAQVAALQAREDAVAAQHAQADARNTAVSEAEARLAEKNNAFIASAKDLKSRWDAVMAREGQADAAHEELLKREQAVLEREQALDAAAQAVKRKVG